MDAASEPAGAVASSVPDIDETRSLGYKPIRISALLDTSYRQKFVRWQIDDFDFINRTLHCPQSEVQEIFTPDESFDEEEALSEHWKSDDYSSEDTKRELLLKLSYCMKRKIQFMQLSIKKRLKSIMHGLKMKTYKKRSSQEISIEEESVSIDESRPLTCSEIYEIYLLRKAQHDRQSEINEMIRVLRAMRCELRNLRQFGCERVQRKLQLEKSIDILTIWMDNVKDEEHCCFKRYKYINIKKVDLSKADTMFTKAKLSCINKCKAFLPKDIYNIALIDFIPELNELVQYTAELRAIVEERFYRIREPKRTASSSESSEEEKTYEYREVASHEIRPDTSVGQTSKKSSRKWKEEDTTSIKLGDKERQGDRESKKKSMK